ncbi:MAG: transglutaminase domain-containing protein [Eubacterium sp.]|nr:transglutaminase domain-containing protein [Eubacterium sp.]
MADIKNDNRINWETANWFEKQRAIRRDRRRRWSKWQNEDRRTVELCKGASIDENVYDISENRYYSLIIKGFIVYLITAGGIGAFLTALEIDFNQVIFNVVILSTAIICATLYHSWKSENLGYLLFFLIYASFIILFRDYINSGFYAVLNDTIDEASIYFDAEGFQYYNERISNRYVAITIAMSVLGTALNVLLNNYILRYARYVVAIGLSLTVNIAAFYMEKEPDTIYTIMVLGGILMTLFLKSGRHFSLSRRDHVFLRSKNGLTYALDYKSLGQGLLITLLLVTTVVGTASALYDKDTYDGRLPSLQKISSREFFQNFIMLGFFGVIDYYPNSGGLSTGELGGVSSIRLDYKTDITVLYTPYSMEPLYIKNFTGATYTPYQNVWEVLWSKNEDGKYISRQFENSYENEVSALENAYNNGEEYSARGYMTITNVEAPALAYQPYYTTGDFKPLFNNVTTTVTYYPRFGNSKISVKEEVDPAFLEVPEINKPVIDDFIEEAGLKKGQPMDVVKQIRDYFEANIPYTIRPGATPWRQDFVNYFLTKNRKGYCAHFATVATLVLREMGIPARYCEGYVISFNQVVDNGEIIEGEQYSNHYDGYNPMDETALVRIDASDADAHAWVEVYDGENGWVKVEVTPSAGLEEEEEDSSFWDAFSNLFGDGETSNSERADNDDNTITISQADNIMKIIAFIVLGLIVLAILAYILIRFVIPDIRFRTAYSRAGLSDKLILRYSKELKKREKKDIKLKNKVNYREQMEYLLSTNEKGRLRMIDILERAGFSKREISQEDYSFAEETFDLIFNKKKA